MNIWNTMSQIDTRNLVEKKNGFTYLSWSHALKLLKDNVPDAMVTKHIFKQPDDTFLPYMIDPQGFAYVQVTVTLGKDVAGATEIMPVLNHANRPVQKPNSFEVNASLQRCMVKAIAALGLGCYIYAGEDMPMESPTAMAESPNIKSDTPAPKKIASPLTVEQEIALAPDVDSLKKLYSRLGPAAGQHNSAFTKRKKELAANG